MIRSMTGFGAGRGTSGSEEMDAEARSVNHKFCEVKVRLPRELSSLEIEIARSVKERLARGGVEVSVRRAPGRAALAPRVDLELAAEYARAFGQLRERLGLPGGIGLAEILDAEGVVTLEERALDPAAARAAVGAAVEGALTALAAMREREGAALARDLDARLALVASLVARVEDLAPQSIEHYRVRLHERIQELARGFTPDPARLAQEVGV